MGLDVLVFRYLIKETLKTQIAIFFILLLIFLSQQFIRTLSEVVEGHLPSEAMSSLLLIGLPKLTQLMLPISFYLAVLFSQSKLHAEHEITALTMLGYGPAYRLVPILLLGCFVGVIALINANWWVPKTLLIKEQFLEDLQQNMGASSLKEGQFTSLKQGHVITYINHQRDNGQFEGLFLVSEQPYNSFLVLAKRGQIKFDDLNRRWLILEDGKRYAGLQSGKEIFISEFSRYEMPFPQPQLPLTAKPDPRNAVTADLQAIATQQWHLAMALSIPLLGLIALALSTNGVREQRRFSKLFLAILLYLALYLLLSAAKSALQKGFLPLYPGVYTVLIVFLIAVALPLWYGTQGLPQWSRIWSVKPCSHT